MGRRRGYRSCIEPLEQRVLLSLSGLEPSFVVMSHGQALPVGELVARSSDGLADPLGSAAIVGLTPTQLRKAYGIDQILFGGVTGDGAGQTIAVINAFDNPAFISSDQPGYASSDLHQFNLAMGLPDPPSFKKIDQRGGTSTPTAVNSTWALEIALDVEWAHAIAPKANIVLIEADSNSYEDLLGQALETARNLPDVSVISMSFGSIEFDAERAWDSTFAIPTGHAGITYIGASGDTGSPGIFPSTANGVMSVGGTTLTLTPTGAYGSESAWSGSGGGISSHQPKPSYQSGVSPSATLRTIPDVAFDADPNSGVAVYDSFNGGTDAPWIQVGGTSFSSPAWAGLIAIANQGRSLLGLNPLNGVSQVLPTLYQLPASNFHDITTGNNGFSAQPGYDLATGRGSPIANTLIPALVNQTSASGQLAGSVYLDSNQSGNIDSGAGLLSGWTIYLDGNSNGSFDAGETSTPSDQWGNFSFSGLSAGSYTLREITPSGYVLHGISSYTVSLTTGQSKAGLNFGNLPSGNSTINVAVYHDSNGNAVRNAGETDFVGAQVYLDYNLNGLFDRNERVFTTDSTGHVSITGLANQLHTLRPVLPSGYVYTGTASSFLTSTAASVAAASFGLSSLSIIHGTVYLDNDASGSFTIGDAFSAVGTVWGDLNSNGLIDPGEPSVPGAANYSLGGLPAGTYPIRIQASGYTQTEPNASGWEFSVSEGAQNQTGDYRFGLFPGTISYASIGGTLFQDTNENAIKDAGEPGLADTTVYIDRNQNGQLDPNETTTLTGGAGAYSFANLLPGTYAIAALLPFAWHQTTPQSGPKVVTVAMGGSATATLGIAANPGGDSFVSGIVYYDSNADGVRQGSETPQSGVSVFVDINDNGIRDAGEALHATDANGRFTIPSFPSDNTFSVDLVVPGGATVTTSGAYEVALLAGDSRTNLEFGLSTTSVIQGSVFFDDNLNNTIDATEAMAEGQQVFLDLNSNGVLDSGEPSLLTAANGRFAFNGLSNRTYSVRVIPAAGLRTVSSSAAGVTVSALHTYSTSPFALTDKGKITGKVYDDQNANGVFNAEPGLAGRTVYLDQNGDGALDDGERAAITDASGNYSLDGLAGGQTYTVRQLVSGGSFATFPLTPAQSAVTPADGEVKTLNLGQNSKPVIANPGGPYTLNEGATIVLSGGASKSQDPAASIISYQWDFNYVSPTFDVDASGATPTFSAVNINGPATRQVALRVSNSNGQAQTIVTTVTVNNFAPTAVFSNNGPVSAGNPVTVSFTGATDPSPADVSAGFKYSYDFNNDGDFVDAGEVANSTSSTAGFTFATPGTFHVHGRIADADAAFTDYSTDVVVNPAATTTLGASADAYVRDGSSATTNFGTAAQLIVKKDAAGLYRESWVKFDLTSLSTITQAKLRLFGKLSNTSSPLIVAVYGSTATTAWVESTLTYNTRPTGLSAELARHTVSSPTGQWFEFDVTTFLQQQKTAGKTSVTFVLQALNSAGSLMQFNSRESATNQPELVVQSGASVTQSLVVTPTTLNVNEGGSSSFSVKLGIAPASNVTVTITKSGGGDANLNAAVSTLTFTPANWNVAQNVSISAAVDADTINGTASFVIASAGVTSQTVTATEVDNTPTSTVTLNASADAYVRDGSSASTNFGAGTQLIVKKDAAGLYRESWVKFDLTSLSTITQAKLRLFGKLSNTSSPLVVAVYGSTATAAWVENTLTYNTRPSGLSVELARHTVSSPTGQWFEFDVTTFLQQQKTTGKTSVTFVLQALNSASSLIQFNSRESATNKPQLVVQSGTSVTQSLVVTPPTLSVNEGSSSSFSVKLGIAPSSNVTVSITKNGGGDANLNASLSTLTFTPANWNVAQNVSITAGADADTINGSASFVVASAGVTSQTVTATEVDNTPTSNITLNATADAYIQDGSNATKNFGTATQLVAKKDAVGLYRESYVKFDLTTLTTVSQAKLRLFGKLNDNYATGLIAGIYGADNATWTESGLTYNNRPAATTTSLATTTILGTTGQWYEFNVTAFLQQEKTLGRTSVTFIVRALSSGPTLINFNSREATGGNGPQLVVSK